MPTTDYFSKFMDIELLENLTSETTTNKLKLMFSRYGIPLVFYSDFGLQFLCAAFKQFIRV